MNKKWLAFLAPVLLGAGWWIYSAPPSYIKIGPSLILSETSEAIVSVTTNDDYLANSFERLAPQLPGYDEVVLFENQQLAFATAIDGWIWQIDLATGTTTQFVDTPLMPAGARAAPDDAQVLYFCASVLYGQTYPDGERVGLYQLDVPSRQITPLVLEVPQVSGLGGQPVVFASGTGVKIQDPAQANAASRPLAFCNDLDVSADGRRIYFTEPFSYADASMGGGGTYREALSLGQNGLVWMYNQDVDEVQLIAQNFTFPDGILVETNAAGQEESLLVAETVKFQIQRMFLIGDRAGQSELVQKNLPAMPDGLDRDEQGRIWVGMIKQRSGVVNWLHQHTWIKHLLLRLPHTWMPVSAATSFMGFDQSLHTPLFYSEHDGSVLTEISVVIPGKDHLYLATVGHDNQGLYRVPNPSLPD
ncbi:MAG: SMP-30/gluconolaconase/LRE-like region [Robiginitomaculum sp.]|nr:MAG: SMP-30/gluconolaconase/LRE-like region [Robiginitomaculum sp.]